MCMLLVEIQESAEIVLAWTVHNLQTIFCVQLCI